MADYCGGCFANFFENGKEVLCSEEVTCQVGDKNTFPEIPLTGPVITGATPARAWRMEPFHVPRLDAGPSARAMRSAKMDGVGPDAMGSLPMRTLRSRGRFVRRIYFALLPKLLRAGVGMRPGARRSFDPDLPGTCEVPCDEVNCLIDPCAVSKCPAYPDAECVANTCGGCFAEYFVGGVQVEALQRDARWME